MVFSARLATETGGLAFFPPTAQGLEAIYATIARELTSQYALAFVAPPAGNHDTFRHVTVRVLPPARGTARTRSGYVPRSPAMAARSANVAE